MAEGDGRGETEGTAGAVPTTGGTDGSDLSSWSTVLVAEFRVDVDPGRSESGFGSAAAAGDGWAAAPPPDGDWAAEIAGGAAEAACGTALEVFIETTISGTATAAATRCATTIGPAPGWCRPSRKIPKTTATRPAALLALRRARWSTWAAAM